MLQSCRDLLAVGTCVDGKDGDDSHGDASTQVMFVYCDGSDECFCFVYLNRSRDFFAYPVSIVSAERGGLRSGIRTVRRVRVLVLACRWKS